MSTMTLYPYLTQWGKEDVWVFDDKQHGLKAEAFVLGMSEMITRVVEEKDLPGADQGFKMTFSDQPFDGADICVEWVEEGNLEYESVETTKTWWGGKKKKVKKNVIPGNWYAGDVYGEVMVGWLCPALFEYFDNAPKKIYVGAEQLPPGVDPIWHDYKKGDRFVDVSASSHRKAS